MMRIKIDSTGIVPVCGEFEIQPLSISGNVVRMEENNA
jgi:hypothetical protein